MGQAKMLEEVEKGKIVISKTARYQVSGGFALA